MTKKALTEGLGLDEITGGKLQSLYDEKLNECILDMADLTKVAKKPRSINISITFTPTSSRREFDIEVGCEAKLAKREKVTSQGFMKERPGGIIDAVGEEVAQMGLDLREKVPALEAADVDPVDV